jgi:histone demethylase
VELFDEQPSPPRLPVPKSNDEKLDLHPRVPTIRVENARDANSVELQNFCYQRDIALVSGLTLALRIDLSQFSTKTLIQTDDHHEVEVRTQLKMPGDANLDNLGNKTWACYSAKSYTTVRRFGQYQAESFK